MRHARQTRNPRLSLMNQLLMDEPLLMQQVLMNQPLMLPLLALQVPEKGLLLAGCLLLYPQQEAVLHHHLSLPLHLHAQLFGHAPGMRVHLRRGGACGHEDGDQARKGNQADALHGAVSFGWAVGTLRAERAGAEYYLHDTRKLGRSQRFFRSWKTIPNVRVAPPSSREIGSIGGPFSQGRTIAGVEWSCVPEVGMRFDRRTGSSRRCSAACLVRKTARFQFHRPNGRFAMRRVAMTCFLGVCSGLGGMLAVTLGIHGLSPAAAQMNAPHGGGSGIDVSRVGERFEYVARKVSPAVVAVEAVKQTPARGSAAKSRSVDESGSGVLIRIARQPGVYVLTNNHVIQQAPPEQITVSLADNRLLKPSRVWADPESDVAIMRVDAAELPTAALGDSDNTRVGQWVLAIGSPFGLNQTVTHGIISARERGQVSLGSTIRIKDFLQTDAAINPGSSGGPLLNLDGEVIGINTAIASRSGSNSGVAFSIPINLVKRIIAQLLERGSVARGYLGLQMAQSFEAADAAALGLNRAQGALVETVYSNTPAATAGLRVRDVVLEVDGVAVRNENHFINLISGMEVGRRIRLTIWRDRRTISVEAVVGDWTAAQARFQRAKDK
jgi:serine protease Do